VCVCVRVCACVCVCVRVCVCVLFERKYTTMLHYILYNIIAIKIKILNIIHFLADGS